MPIASGKVPEVGREETTRAVTGPTDLTCALESVKREKWRNGETEKMSRNLKENPKFYIYSSSRLHSYNSNYTSWHLALNSAFVVPMTAELPVTYQRVPKQT